MLFLIDSIAIIVSFIVNDKDMLISAMRGISDNLHLLFRLFTIYIVCEYVRIAN